MYVCPMHPDVRQEGPGRCSKCGMALVPEEESRAGQSSVHREHGQEGTTWRSYVPLVVIFFVLAATTGVLAWRDSEAGTFDVRKGVATFMAGFFLVFASFKLMDLRGFADGYSTYDLLARRVYAYGFVYPLIELGFGLSMAAGLDTPALLWSEFAVMAFSGIGVAIKVAKREKFQCACLGTFLKVPLTTVTLIEDFGMAALAFFLLFY